MYCHQTFNIPSNRSGSGHICLINASFVTDSILHKSKMGLSASKSFEEMFPESAPATPARKQVIDDHFDPRSPSGQITRTPIQVMFFVR